MFKAGSAGDFDGSMAAAIETEFEALWQNRYGVALPAETRDDRRLIFLAVANGVVKHLRECADTGFSVAVTATQKSGNRVTSSSGGALPSISVKQDAASSNAVVSEGEAKVSVKVEGLD
jgi:hypothetical protein